MMAVSGKDAATLRHLPPLLAYHITLVDLLAACAIGSKNINIVEAKLQSMYPLDSLLTALLDDSLVTEARLALLRYLRQAFVDAEMKFHGLAGSKLLWKFFAKVRERERAKWRLICSPPQSPFLYFSNN